MILAKLFSHDALLMDVRAAPRGKFVFRTFVTANIICRMDATTQRRGRKSIIDS